MATATSKEPRQQWASTVVDELTTALDRKITLDDLARVLSIKDMKGRTFIDAKSKAKAKRALKKEPVGNPQPSAPPTDSGEPTKPLSEAVGMILERQGNTVEPENRLTVAQAAQFLSVAEDAEITVPQFEALVNEFRIKVSEGNELETRVRSVGRFARHRVKLSKRRRKDPTLRDRKRSDRIVKKMLQPAWAAVDDPNWEPKIVVVAKSGWTGYKDEVKPGRIISMEYPEFLELKKKGLLSPVHEDTIAELAEELTKFSQFHTHGVYCGESLDVYTLGIARAMFERRLLPPLYRPNETQKKKWGLQEARPFFFYDEHPACRKLINMMSDLEGEFTGPEGPAKDTVRAAGYSKALRGPAGDGTERTLLAAIIESEWVYDPSAPKYRRRLSAQELINRMRAINETLNKTTEEVA